MAAAVGREEECIVLVAMLGEVLWEGECSYTGVDVVVLVRTVW